MYLKACVCALSFVLPHAIAFFIPSPLIALGVCLIGQALICFPLFCGLYRGKLSLAFGKLWPKFFLCGLDLAVRFSLTGLVCMLPFSLLQTSYPFAASLLGGAGITIWMLCCTRWICLARFAHLPHRYAFRASANAVRKTHMYAFLILLKAAVCLLLIVLIPNGLLLLIRKTSQFSTENPPLPYFKTKGEIV